MGIEDGTWVIWQAMAEPTLAASEASSDAAGDIVFGVVAIVAVIAIAVACFLERRRDEY